MKIVVPESLLKELRMLKMRHESITVPADRLDCTFRGPYGDYELVGRPDIEYTEEKLEPVRRYREE